MKRITKIPSLIFFLLSISVCSVYGQSGLINYGTVNSSLYNPSFLQNNRQYEASVFPAANFEVDAYLPFSLSTLFSKSDDGGYEINLGTLSEKLAKTNQAMLCLSVGYLNLATNIQSNRWVFRVSENIVSSFEFEGELVSFINQGNKAYLGQWFETSFPMSFKHYSVIQATTSRILTPKLKLGISAKLYFGKATVNAQNTLSFYTEEKAEYVDLKTNGKILASFPLNRNLHQDGYLNGWEFDPAFTLSGYLLNVQNPGLGIDVGIEYRYNDKWLFTGALIDLGFISWFSNINSMDVDGLKRWDGFDISPIVHYRTNEEVFDDILNLSLADSFLFAALTPVDNAFLTLAPLKVIAGARYSLSGKLHFSAINQLMVNDIMLRESLFLLANYIHNDNWELQAGLSFTNHALLNLPVGVSYHNKQISATLSVSNLWGLALPDYSRQFGGSFSLAYRFQVKSQAEKLQMERYPFSNPYKYKNGKVSQP